MTDLERIRKLQDEIDSLEDEMEKIVGVKFNLSGSYLVALFDKSSFKKI